MKFSLSSDPVEFEMTYDRRTGKPIASFVVKISSEAISEELSSERVTGFITIELSDEKGKVLVLFFCVC